MPPSPAEAGALVVLGLGSNRNFTQGPGPALDSRALLVSAVGELGAFLAELRLAPLYQSEPLHVKDQAPFLNTVAAGRCGLSLEELLAAVQDIEARHGRDRSRERRWGERTLDIDILLFGDLVLATPELTIPHPRLRERRFALAPLLDLFPQAREPGSGRYYRTILRGLDPQGLIPLGPLHACAGEGGPLY